jgi:iron complex transport system permease protein
MKRALLVVTGLAVVHLSLGRGVDWVALFRHGDALSWQILLQLRLPRLIAALASGAALAVSGLVLQRLLRNPLASPELTAVNPTAVFALLAMTSTGLISITDPVATAGVAFLGGLTGGLIMWLVSQGRSAQEAAVVGVLAAMAFTGVTTIILSAKSMGLAGVLRWLIGSLDGIVSDNLGVLVPAVLVGVLAVHLVAPILDIVAVSDRHAINVGLVPDQWRAIGLLFASWLGAAAVAVVGPLAFVGFLAPHLHTGITRGRPLRSSVLGVAVLGGAFVVGSDVLAMAASMAIQSGSSGHQVGVPTGAVTSLIGAAALVHLAGRGHRMGTDRRQRARA